MGILYFPTDRYGSVTRNTEQPHAVERLAGTKPNAEWTNPRAWIVTKQGMTGDLYEALAWDNGGKPLGVSCTPPIPLYEAMPASHKPTCPCGLFAFLRPPNKPAPCGLFALWRSRV